MHHPLFDVAYAMLQVVKMPDFSITIGTLSNTSESATDYDPLHWQLTLLCSELDAFDVGGSGLFLWVMADLKVMSCWTRQAWAW